MVPSVAIIMPARNAERHVREALQSVFRQSSSALFDVIVIDDASTDSTRKIVADEIRRGMPVRIIESPGKGIAAARNAGLAALKEGTDFVAFLDADDVSPAGRFDRGLGCFAQDPALDVQFGYMRVVYDIDASTLEPAPGEIAVDVRGMQLGAGLFRAVFLKAVGAFDTEFVTGEDMDFLLRVFEANPKYLLTGDVCVYYRRHDANTSRDLKQVQRGFMQALMKSARRRKGRTEFRYPPDLFDGSNLARMRGL